MTGQQMSPSAVSEFVESWGSMGSLWGINRSMARVQALLLATKEPLGLEEVASQLRMSRGNASMCLKELRNWGVVRRINLTGERRDFYIAETDIWSMAFRIATERKKREFDPALEALRRVLSSTGKDDEIVRERLGELEELLASVDHVLRRVLADEGASRAMLKFLAVKIPGRKGQ